MIWIASLMAFYFFIFSLLAAASRGDHDERN